jgi:hypothetical protein
MKSYLANRLPALLGLVPGLTGAQTYYTDEQINSQVCNLPYEWDMLNNEYSNGQQCPAFPAGFNRFNIIETDVFIHSDLNSAGKSSSASTLFRLSPNSSKLDFGGEFTLRCIGDVGGPNIPYCAYNMRRGAHYVGNGNTEFGYHFESAQFSDPTFRRAWGRTDYLNMGVAPVTKTSNDYYFPIGGWDMSTSPPPAALNVDTVYLPNLDINKIAGISTIILSNPDVNGKVSADQFDRRGISNSNCILPDDAFGAYTRGGIIDVVPYGTGSRVFLKLPYTETFSYRKNMFSGVNYQGKSTNRGWVKITYYGTASGFFQPFAMKSKVRSIGSWPLSNPGQGALGFPFSDFGIPANRLTHADVTIHQDDRGFGHDLSPLKRTPYHGEDAQAGQNASLFTINEAANRFKMYACASDRPTGYMGYYAYNHFSGAPYNRGWIRVDYQAGTCATAATGFAIKQIPSASNGTCGGGSGSLTTVEGSGADIWGTNDEFTFMYKTFTAGENKTFTAKIESQSNSDGWAKAGIMFRSSLSSNAKYASMLATPSNGTHFTYRPDGTNTVTARTSNTTIKAPYWLRVQKVGKVFTGFWSSNGTTWSSVGSQTLNSFGNTFYVGIAVSSHNKESTVPNSIPGTSKPVFSNLSGI